MMNYLLVIMNLNLNMTFTLRIFNSFNSPRVPLNAEGIILNHDKNINLTCDVTCLKKY